MTPFRLQVSLIAILSLILLPSLHPLATADRADAPESRAYVLGGQADLSLIRPAENGGMVLQAGGRESYGGMDEGSFYGFQTDALHFTLTVRIISATEAGPNAKFGLTLREGLRGPEKAIHLRHDRWEGNRCVQWFMRHHVAPNAAVGSMRCHIDSVEREIKADSNLWLRMVRRYPFVELSASEDGTTWKPVAGDYRPVLMPGSIWAGVQATAGGDGRRPIEVTFDQFSFQVDHAPAQADRPETWQEHPGLSRPWKMTQVRLRQPGRDIEFTPFLLMPRDMRPSEIRGIIYSAGSKEVLLDTGRIMDFDNGPGQLRKPRIMDDFEGSIVIDNIHPWNEVWAAHGLVRVGGAFSPEHFAMATEALAKATGLPIDRLPFVATGGSFAGGFSAQSAARYPERAIAVAPMIIGQAGSNTNDRQVLDVPHLHVWGSRDGSHLRDAMRAIPELRTKKALWASAPMWMVQHHPQRSDSIIRPWFFELMRLRLPERIPAQGPIPLRPLNYDDGWYGLVSTWESNFPQVVPVQEHEGEDRMLVWFPNELTARMWQSFSSNHPRTVIHFPSDEGSTGFGGSIINNWHISTMTAGRPWELVASGPVHEELSVTYYAGLTPLKVRETHDGNPYRVTMEPLEPGVHVIHAVTRFGDRTEISRPVTVYFARP